MKIEIEKYVCDEEVNMLKMKKCCSVPFPEKLTEQYEIQENRIVANVGTDKITNMMLEFIDMHDEWLFFILELPTNWNDEPKDENGELIGRHKDVFYIDGCSQEKAKAILMDVGDLLIDDGMNCFGFGGHESKEEILLDKYNVMTVYTKNPEKYESFLKNHNITKTDNLVTAWNTFSEDYYGESEIYEIDGKDIYSIPEDYKKYGIYFAERRDE